MTITIAVIAGCLIGTASGALCYYLLRARPEPAEPPPALRAKPHTITARVDLDDEEFQARAEVVLARLWEIRAAQEDVLAQREVLDGIGMATRPQFDPETSHADALEALKDADCRTTAAIDAIVRLGHTEHCARAMAWGHGECECGGATPGAEEDHHGFDWERMYHIAESSGKYRSEKAEALADRWKKTAMNHRANLTTLRDWAARWARAASDDGVKEHWEQLVEFTTRAIDGEVVPDPDTTKETPDA